MRIWNLWKKTNDSGAVIDIAAVPQGFHIPAFLFSWLWGLFIHGLRKRSLLYAFFTFLTPVALFVAVTYHFYSVGEILRWEQSLSHYWSITLIGMISLIVQIQYGWKANRWRDRVLRQTGYLLDDQVVLAPTAAKAVSAAAQPLAEGYRPNNILGAVFTIVWCGLFVWSSITLYPATKEPTPGTAYRYGISLFRHGGIIQGLAIIRSLAHEGYPRAELFWSNILLFGGYGVQKNLPDAIYWTELAAKNGDMGRALTRLGDFVAIGDLPGGKARAISLWERAAEMGYTQDIHAIRRYPWAADVWGAKQGDRELLGALLQGAERGNAIAAYYVGRLEISHHPTIPYAPYDPAQAIQFFSVSAHKGYRNGEYDLAQAFGFGWNHQPIQENKADYWWYQSAKQGVNLGANNLGYSYEIGSGVPKNLALAAYWFDIGWNYGYGPDKHKLARVEKQLTPVQKLELQHMLRATQWPQFGAGTHGS